MKKYINIGVAVLLLLPFFVEAQSFKNDLEAMYSSYTKATDFYAKVEVKMYEKAIDTKPTKHRKATIRKSGWNFLYDIDDTKMLMNDKCAVIVNKEEKIIVYKKGERADLSSVPEIVTPDFDSLLANYDKVVYKGFKGNNKLYTIILEDSHIKQVDVYLDKDKKWLKKMVYYYNKAITDVDSRVVVTFSGISDQPNFSKTQFSEKQFVIKQKGKMTLHPNYKSYRLIEMETAY